MSNPYQPGSPIKPNHGTPAGGKPDNYLVHAIIVTLCCCLPFGVASIVFASQVDSKWNKGDYAGAQKASDQAKLFFWLSLGLGLVAQIINIVIQFSLVAAEANNF